MGLNLHSPKVFMTRCLTKHRDNFIIYQFPVGNWHLYFWYPVSRWRRPNSESSVRVLSAAFLLFVLGRRSVRSALPRDEIHIADKCLRRLHSRGLCVHCISLCMLYGLKTRRMARGVWDVTWVSLTQGQLVLERQTLLLYLLHLSEDAYIYIYGPSIIFQVLCMTLFTSIAL